MVRMQCPGCGAKTRGPAKAFEKEIECPKCGAVGFFRRADAAPQPKARMQPKPKRFPAKLVGGAAVLLVIAAASYSALSGPAEKPEENAPEPSPAAQAPRRHAKHKQLDPYATEQTYSVKSPLRSNCVYKMRGDLQLCMLPAPLLSDIDQKEAAKMVRAGHVPISLSAPVVRIACIGFQRDKGGERWYEVAVLGDDNQVAESQQNKTSAGWLPESMLQHSEVEYSGPIDTSVAKGIQKCFIAFTDHIRNKIVKEKKKPISITDIAYKKLSSSRHHVTVSWKAKITNRTKEKREFYIEAKFLDKDEMQVSWCNETATIPAGESQVVTSTTMMEKRIANMIADLQISASAVP